MARINPIDYGPRRFPGARDNAPPRAVHSIAAIVLPVSLGLGLIYLYVVGRISALTAIVTILALGGFLVGAAYLSRAAEED